LKTVLILYNKKGLTLIECIIALFLVTIAIVTLMTMQPLAWKGASKSDFLGKAAGILQRELETFENNFMQGTTSCTCTFCTSTNDCTSCTCNGASPPWNSTYIITKDNIPFTVNALACDNSAGACNNTIPLNTWLVNVRITWPGSVNGIKSSIIVSKVF
jgi:prepilin-type N-terminal cleavage/methylation domain-containing protein